MSNTKTLQAKQDNQHGFTAIIYLLVTFAISIIACFIKLIVSV